jgi:hypothetical protein
MRSHNLKVEYVESSKLGHGTPLDYTMSRRITDFVKSQRRSRDKETWSGFPLPTLFMR